MSKRGLQKLGVLLFVLICVGLFFLFDLQRYLDLQTVKASQGALQQLFVSHPAPVLGAYFVIYIAVTALMLPGALVLSLLGGAVFGLLPATLAVSFASTIGATIACLFSRFILRDWVQGRYGDKLAVVNEGIRREGAFYLFSMRLIPIFPFFVVNLVMGVTRMPLRTFFWVSQLGMLPGTVVFINAGKELGRIESAAGILSPTLVFSFILLGLFPLVAKRITGRVRKRITQENNRG